MRKNGVVITYNKLSGKFDKYLGWPDFESRSIVSGLGGNTNMWFIEMRGMDNTEVSGGNLNRREWRNFMKEVTSDININQENLYEFLKKEFGMTAPVKIDFEDVKIN